MCRFLASRSELYAECLHAQTSHKDTIKDWLVSGISHAALLFLCRLLHSPSPGSTQLHSIAEICLLRQRQTWAAAAAALITMTITNRTEPGRSRKHLEYILLNQNSLLHSLSSTLQHATNKTQATPSSARPKLSCSTPAPTTKTETTTDLTTPVPTTSIDKVDEERNGNAGMIT